MEGTLSNDQFSIIILHVMGAVSNQPRKRLEQCVERVVLPLTTSERDPKRMKRPSLNVHHLEQITCTAEEVLTWSPSLLKTREGMM